MLIIGERINSTRPKIREAIQARNAHMIAKEARSQVEAGARYIDVNCAMGLDDEALDIDWVISVIQSEMPDVNICIDSPNYLAIDRALGAYKAKGRVMINSISGEEERIRRILPLAKKKDAELIALTMDGNGLPSTAAERFQFARNIFERLKKEGFNTKNLYFDPLVRPIATEPQQAKEFLGSLSMIKGLGNVKTICGLSNVSFGLPNRSLINAAFLSMATHAGLDSALLDPLDKKVYSSLAASSALLGADDYCSGYIKAFREGKLT